MAAFQFCYSACCVGALLIAGASACIADPPPRQWTYDGAFHDAISVADRIVVRPVGLNGRQPISGQPIGGEKTHFEVADAREVRRLADHLKFNSPQQLSSCFCYGDVTIEWYKDDKRLARASVKHGAALLWSGFRADVQLTEDSATWIVDWLAKHGVARPKEQLDRTRLIKAVRREARPVLQKFMPDGFLDALKRAAEADAQKPVEANANSGVAAGFVDRRDDLFDEHIRSVFKGGAEEMYPALFRLMGCLPMRWDARYMPEQDEAYDFLIRAPRDELDRAFRSASRSKDRAERLGAARIVFSQHYMVLYGKTDTDISRWMVMLAEAAYADPFAANRRLVFNRLEDDKSAVPSLAVLEQAALDPDQTVRRKAYRLLRKRGGPKALPILRRIAAGEIQPRAPGKLPTDYGMGTGVRFNTLGMDSEKYYDTDREAADKALFGT